jgi:hypothetical protein
VSCAVDALSRSPHDSCSRRSPSARTLSSPITASGGCGRKTAYVGSRSAAAVRVANFKRSAAEERRKRSGRVLCA